MPEEKQPPKLVGVTVTPTATHSYGNALRLSYDPRYAPVAFGSTPSSITMTGCIFKDASDKPLYSISASTGVFTSWKPDKSYEQVKANYSISSMRANATLPLNAETAIQGKLHGVYFAANEKSPADWYAQYEAKITHKGYGVGVAGVESSFVRNQAYGFVDYQRPKSATQLDVGVWQLPGHRDQAAFSMMLSHEQQFGKSGKQSILAYANYDAGDNGQTRLGATYKTELPQIGSIKHARAQVDVMRNTGAFKNIGNIDVRLEVPVTVNAHGEHPIKLNMSGVVGMVGAPITRTDASLHTIYSVGVTASMPAKGKSR